MIFNSVKCASVSRTSRARHTCGEVQNFKTTLLLETAERDTVLHQPRGEPNVRCRLSRE